MAESLKGQVAPKSPPGAPAHVQHLLSKLSESLDLDAPRTAFLALRENLIYLLEFFAGTSAAAASEAGALDAKTKALWKSDASLTDVENLLCQALTALEASRSNPAIGNLRSVFFVGDTTSKPSPRRHSRLLRMAGAPFRGYVFLSEFAELKPASRDAFAAEVKRYLPILKEWLTAAQPFFKDLRITEEGVTAEGHAQVVLEAGNYRLDLGPAIRVSECALCPTVTARAVEPAKVPAAAARSTAAAKSGSAKTAVAKKPEGEAATPVKSGVVKKVLVVKRPDGTIVRKVVQTVAASDAAKTAAKAEPAKTAEPAKAPVKAGEPPAPRPELIAPEAGKSVPVKPVAKKPETDGKPDVGSKAGPVAAEPEKAEKKAEPVAAKPEKAEEKAAEVEGAQEKAERVQAEEKVEPVPTEPEKAEKAEPVATEPEKAEQVATKPEKAEEKAEKAEPVATEPEKAEEKAERAEPVATEPEKAEEKAEKAEPVATEPEKAEEKAEKAEPVATEPEQAKEPVSESAAEEQTEAAVPDQPEAQVEPEKAEAKAEASQAEEKAESKAEPGPAQEKTEPERAEPVASGAPEAAVPPEPEKPAKTEAGSGAVKAPVKPPSSSGKFAKISESEPEKLEAKSGGVKAPVKPPSSSGKFAKIDSVKLEEERPVESGEAAEPEQPKVVKAPVKPPSSSGRYEAVQSEPQKPEKAEPEPPLPQPGKLAPEPEVAPVIPDQVALPELEPAPSPEPVGVLDEAFEPVGEDELLMGAPEEGDVVLEEVELSEEELLLGAPDEMVEEAAPPPPPAPAPAAVSLSSQAPVVIPQGAPDHLRHILEALNAAIKSNDASKAAAEVQAGWDFMLRYYAGVVSMSWRSAERKLPENARQLMRNWASLGACRELLVMGLGRINSSEAINAALVAAFKGGFYDIIQKRGADLVAWCEKPLEGSGTTEAINTYLPELRDWLKKSEDYLEGCEHFAEPPSAEGHLEIVVQYGESFLELCAPDFVIQIRECPVCLPKLRTAKAAPAPVVEEKEAAPELADLLFGGAPDEFGTSQMLGAAAPPQTLIVKMGGPGPAPGKTGIFAGLSKKMKVSMPAPLSALGIEIPESIPEHLGHILNRVSYGVSHQDPQETSLSVRDALEYLVRYFAGVAGMAAKNLGKAGPEITDGWTAEPMSVSRCEHILFHSLKALSASDDPMAVLLRQVFPTGVGDAHTRTITLDVENRLKALGKFCAQTQANWDKVRSIRENSRFLPVLKDWLTASKGFFNVVETLAEPPSEDGKMEIVVNYKDHFLELLPPDYCMVVRRCPVCLPNYKGTDPPVPEEEEAAPPPRPETVSPLPAEPAETSVPGRRLDQEMDDLLQGKAPRAEEKPPPSGEAPRPRPGLASPADDEEPAMAHDVSFIGTGKSEDGRIIHGGYINVVNVGGGVLSATVRGTHPCISVKPVRFKGKHCRIEYQIDEADLPSSRKVYVVIRSANEAREIPVWQMLPPTSTLSMSDNAFRAFMAIPMIVYFFIFTIVHTQSNRLVEGILRTALTAKGLNSDIHSLTPGYLSTVKLDGIYIGQLGGVAQFDGLVFILFSGLVPLAVAKIFSLAPPDQIHRNRKWFIGFLLAPLVIVTAIVVPFFHSLVSRPELKPMIFTSSMYLWFLFLNGLAAFYLYITRLSELEQWIQMPFMRNVVGVVVWSVYLLCVMQAVLLR